MKHHNFVLVGGDTDGLAFKKPDEKPFTQEERQALLDELNSYMDELIRWEDDGVYKRQIVVKAKNYILQDEAGKVKIKGSALKATTKEKALQRFIKEVVECLLKDRKDHILMIYLEYAKEIMNIKDISDWCFKKTITKSVLNPERTNEQRVLDALNELDVREGDKVYVFYKTPEELCLREKFDGTYDRDTLLKKLYNTLEVFGTIIDMSLIPNFALKRNKPLLECLIPKIEVQPTKPSPFPPGFFNVRTTT